MKDISNNKDINNNKDISNNKDINNMTNIDIINYLLEVDKILIIGECEGFTHLNSIEEV